MKITQDQIKRIEKDWTRTAGEAVRVEEYEGILYGFGSELATLRIWKSYINGNKNPRINEIVNQGFSANQNSFYLSLNTNPPEEYDNE